MQLYQSILAGKIEYPRHMKKEARDLISKLLTADLSRRLGNLKGGGRDIRMHPWFKGFDWEALLQRTMPAPIQINPRSDDDTSMFDEYDEDDGPDVGAGKVTQISYRPRHIPHAFPPHCLLMCMYGDVGACMHVYISN
jgi:hypothetical protein